ncbi:MAG: hypothetical protein ACREJN_17735 [Nitrospiraceae bacterium]
MTTSQAADLRMKWKRRTNPPNCMHLAVELETTETGYLTGDFHCIVCGELLVKTKV